jgi:hypothetical protein
VGVRGHLGANEAATAVERHGEVAGALRRSALCEDEVEDIPESVSITELASVVQSSGTAASVGERQFWDGWLGRGRKVGAETRRKRGGK